MINFKEWFTINESKEEKALSLELAGNVNVLSSLSEVIPQGRKETDKLLLLASYYYSQNKNLQQIKVDMTDYIGYVKSNRMPLIVVDLVSKKPSDPWDDYLYWTQVIHGHQGEDSARKKSSFKPSDIDFQNEKPFLTSLDGKIRVYEANNPQQCIILGKGQSFCISQPGNTMWQSYRDSGVSTFYFVYDDTRDDRLSIVVIDEKEDKTILTDKANTTGTTLDPYTRKLTDDSNSYMKYLKKSGIDVSKIINVPKSSEEREEHEKLGRQNENLNWFISLSSDYKSKYIGRGHLLTDEQFDYLWKNKFNYLLTQYVKTGLLLSDYQIDKIAKNRDLKDNYLHNRLLAIQHHDNLSNKEYYLLNSNQKEIYFGTLSDEEKLIRAIKLNNLELVKNLVEKGVEIDSLAINGAAEIGNLDIVKYLMDKGGEISYDTISYAVNGGNLDIVKYLVEKGGEIDYHAINNASANGHLDVVKYLVEKGGEINDTSVVNASANGHLDVVKYLVEKGGEISDFSIVSAANNGHLDIVKYLVEKGGEIRYDAISYAAYNGHLDVVKYLVEKGGEISRDAISFSYAVNGGNLDIVKYLVEKGAKITSFNINVAASIGRSDIVDYLTSKIKQ